MKGFKPPRCIFACVLGAVSPPLGKHYTLKPYIRT